ncbi:MAG: hypothetical protein FVQ79_08720 [Planctomycetes bacterium]|nr:hypothetical protein [Planctomycetota bacterium]
MGKPTGKETKKMEPAKVLSFNYTKYPDVLDAANKLSDITDRNPHNAVNQAMKAIRGNMKEFLVFCRDHGIAI